MNTTLDALTQTRSLTGTILQNMDGITKSKYKFMTHILVLYMSMRDRYNFLSFSRYGSYSERSYRNQFEGDFDFLSFNIRLIAEQCSPNLIIAFDPSYIPKSGKQTDHLGYYWSGVSGKSLKGLEIGGLAAVDIDNNTAMSLEAVQTPSKSILANKEMSLPDHYAQLIIDRSAQLKSISSYLVVDGYFAKEGFVTAITENTALEVVCKLRNDANLRYLAEPNSTGKKGRPKKYAGKIDMKNIDKTLLPLVYHDDGCKVYSGIVWCVCLKRKVKLSYVEFWNNGKYTNRYAVLFSTDLELDGKLIYTYYKARFQIEFLFRDAKQFTGLNHCQARSEKKLHFHFNTSLTTISLAKTIWYLPLEKQKRGPFSMRNVKTLNINKLNTDRIFSNLNLNLTCKKIQKIYREAIFFGKMAA